MNLLHTITKRWNCILYEILVGNDEIISLYKQWYLDNPHWFYQTILWKKVLRQLSDEEKNSLLKSNKIKKSS